MKLAEKTWLDEASGPVSAEIRALLKRVDDYCTAKNWTRGYFGKHVAGDDTIVVRLANTGKVQARLILRIEEYLAKNEGLLEPQAVEAAE